MTLACAGCGQSSLGSCDLDPDLTGRWTFTLAAADVDGGASEIPRGDTITADLTQHSSSALLDITKRIWGTLTSTDTSFFTTIQIPQLSQNDGSKTGAALGCTVKINVPIAANVTDDNVDQGPLRLAISGRVVAHGSILGDDTSTVIMTSDQTNTPRTFAWTGARQ